MPDLRKDCLVVFIYYAAKARWYQQQMASKREYGKKYSGKTQQQTRRSSLREADFKCGEPETYEVRQKSNPKSGLRTLGNWTLKSAKVQITLGLSGDAVGKAISTIGKMTTLNKHMITLQGLKTRAQSNINGEREKEHYCENGKK
ncbi:unnamed protein product [Calicophoron daubneyi]|uniref:Uncharacterized protein n=1 Tax=Calicophoron daubneyi TaxID=300641 RepID=A0AAV2U1I9_CALDB